MNKNLLGISAKIGFGKDTFFEILQEKTSKSYENKKFAGKLKEISSILTGIPVDKFEDQEFKKTYLGKEWNKKEPNFNLGTLSDGSQIMQDVQMTVRKFLQVLGTEAMRDTLHENVWVNSLFSDYNITDRYKLLPPNRIDLPEYQDLKFPKWCITDMRFPNEYDAIKEKGGILIRINRPGITFNEHLSETSLDNHKFDYVIENDGTLEDFKLKVEDCLKNFNII